MRLPAQRVEDEDVEAGEQRDAFGGDVAQVSEVGCRAEAIASNRIAAVHHRNALEAGAKKNNLRARFGRKPMQRDTGAGGVAVFGVSGEGVGEDSLNGGSGRLVGV